jgi:O-antigen/teichoic acid export membrane protein
LAVPEALTYFRDTLKTKTAKQSLTLYASQIIVLGLNVAINVVNTRFLGPFEYGILSFCSALIAFIVLFFEFGVFTAGARILALSKNDKEEKEYIGTLLVLAILIGISFGIFIFILSFFVDQIFDTHVSYILRSVAILSAIFPFQSFIQQICQGTNNIGKLSLHKVVWYSWYLIILLFVITLFKLTTLISLIIAISGLIIATFLIISRLKPLFRNLRGNLRVIFRETKVYGFHVYLGRVIGMSTYDLDQILISYFVNTTAVGFYYLGVAVSRPISMLSGAISTSLFKDMARRDRIPKKVIYYNFLWLLFSCLGLIIFGRYIILFLFSEKFLPTVPLILPLALTAFFSGMFQPYNYFLAAKGKGKYLRNAAIILTVCNLVGNFTLIPIYGALGAAYASLFSLIVDYVAHVHYYRKSIKIS